jgi:hypothetical protein
MGLSRAAAVSDCHVCHVGDGGAERPRAGTALPEPAVLDRVGSRTAGEPRQLPVPVVPAIRLSDSAVVRFLGAASAMAQPHPMLCRPVPAQSDDLPDGPGIRLFPVNGHRLQPVDQPRGVRRHQADPDGPGLGGGGQLSAEQVGHHGSIRGVRGHGDDPAVRRPSLLCTGGPPSHSLGGRRRPVNGHSGPRAADVRAGAGRRGSDADPAGAGLAAGHPDGPDADDHVRRGCQDERGGRAVRPAGRLDRPGHPARVSPAARPWGSATWLSWGLQGWSYAGTRSTA